MPVPVDTTESQPAGAAEDPLTKTALPEGRSWLAALILFALIVGLHHAIIFDGRSLVHSNYSNPFDYRPLRDNYGANLIPHDEWTKRNLWPFPNVRDPGAAWWQWEPSTELLKRAIRQREWPFWDPYIGAGTPAMANMVPAFFFPPYTVLAALGAPVSLKNAYFLLLLWSAAFLTFLFLRHHDLSFLSSLFGGVTVVMGGAMNQNLGSFAAQTAACLPLTLYVTRHFLDRIDRRRTTALVATYAAAALASFPPLLLAVFGISALYAAVAIASGDCAGGSRGRLRAGLSWTAAVLLSIGLVGFYYLPVGALRDAVPHVAAMYSGAGLESMPLVNAYQLLSPTIMGGVQVYFDAPFASPGLAAHIPYVGIVCVMAALLARPVPGRPGRSLFITSVVAGVVILLKLFGAPPVQWIARLPFFSQIHFAHYFGVPLGFLMAFLSAQGLEAMLRGSASRARMLLAAVIALILVESLWRMGERAPGFNKETAEYWVRDWRFLGLIGGVSAIVFGVVAVTGAARRGLVTASVSLLALAAAEGEYNNAYPRPRAWNAFEHAVPYVRLLQRDAQMARVLAFGTPPANSNEAFGVFVLDSLMPFNPPRIYELYRRYTSAPAEVFMRQARYIPPEPVLDRANIAFVGSYAALDEPVREAVARGYRRRFDNGFVVLFDRKSQPRFLYSSAYRVVSKTSALDAIASAPSWEIVLEEAPAFPSSPRAPGDPDVQLESYGLNSAALLVDAPRPGLVYASESYFDGWTASVNNTPARILPANYAFRAVVVPAGRSRVEFHYWPPGLTAGLALSGLSTTVVLVWVMIPAAWPGRRRETELTI
jgi:hypothetical protein